LGSAEEELGNDGEYAYQKALALNNDLALAHHLYGKYQWRKGQIDQAIASFKTAFELDPSNPAVPADLGGLYAAQANLPEAEFWYRQAVQVAPDKSLPWLWLARFYVEYDLKVDGDGLLSAQKAVELDPESAPAHDVLGFAQYLNGDDQDAESNLAKAISLDPQLASAHFHLGLLLLDGNRIEEAKQSLDRALTLDAGGPIAERAIQALARLGITAQPTATP
ncbi:MAG TPA: tetratricopeptide repeat protein, partial [Anaerolineales bacterium]|nr:tetratricopeptide repeat protein [Anaerolineales bacterium]